LLNVLTGLASVTSGEIAILGMEPRKNRKEVLSRTAVVPQETAIYGELTARENLEFHAAYYGLPKAAIRDRVEEALSLVELQARADDRAGTFSGGMQRRLALARAMLMRPDLLLLDEPTLGVDVQSREAIWQRIERIAAEGRSVLLTTNYMEEAERLGDHILIIDKGRNVTEGTLENLMAAVPTLAVRVDLVSEEAAAETARKLDAPLSFRVEGVSLIVSGTTEQALFGDLKSLLDVLPATQFVRLDMLRPNLQDVFLHFTGRELRN
jgi:ABC-2 type transport system ATP-binding protein